MTPLFKKMNLKNQKCIHLFSHPPSFEAEIESISDFAEIRSDDFGSDPIEFALAFVQSPEDLKTLAKPIHNRLVEDGLMWYAFPKKSSKKYKATISRDVGWECLGELSYEGVRAISIDEDWSAIRFRKVRYIKNFTRNKDMIWSKEGKERKG